MIALLLATKMEAEPLAEKLGASQVASEPFATWRFEPADGRPGGLIVVAGMGKDAAARGTEHLIAACGASMVINVGICGALSDGVAADELMRISSVVDGDAVLADQPAEPVPCSLSAWMDLPTRRLASVSVPVFEDHQRLKLAAFADAVDMEGFAVAEVCRCHGVMLFILKGVTDLANHTGKQDILSNIGRVSTRLAGAVAAGLARFGDAHRGGSAPGKVMSFAKIEHGVFSLPLLLAGAKLGAEAKLGSTGTWPSLGVLGLIALAGIGARTMGMAMNRVLDRRLDAMNPRTAGRELPSGRMTFAAGLAVAAAGLGLYLLACGLLGPPCLALSPVPAVPLITYSLLKRFTNLCHFGIGLCLALAPLGAYVAAAGMVSMSQCVLLLGLFAFCWMSGFDIIYAIQDLDSDRQTGVRSLPVSLGPTGASAVAAGLHVVALAALALLWRSTGGGWFSGAAGGVAFAAFVLGHLPSIPAAKRFFPISAIASIAGSSVPLLGGLG
jgi:4-hydroxybenzoate polyprenyltransferase